MPTPELLNAAAVVLVFAFGLGALYQLDVAHKSHGRFLVRAFFCWLAALACWIALWGLQVVTPHDVPLSEGHSHALMLLSDLNTAFILLFYVALTRADDISSIGLGICGFAASALFLIVDLALMQFSGQNGLGMALQERWSMALSMAAPVLVGWACSLRFGSSVPLIVGILYAISQPAAQLSVLNPVVPVPTKNVILTLLAAMKIGYGWAVIHTVGRVPTSFDNLVPATTGQPARFIHARWWWLSGSLLLIGGGVIAVTVAANASKAFWSMTSPILGFLGFVATILTIVDFLLKRLRSSHA